MEKKTNTERKLRQAEIDAVLNFDSASRRLRPR